MYEEFFGIEESEQYAFYRVPKLLFTNERYRSLSAESKLLYGLFLDRMGISRKNGWFDKDGRVYIIYTVDELGLKHMFYLCHYRILHSLIGFFLAVVSCKSEFLRRNYILCSGI